MKLEVGMYVRTKEGYIRRIKNIWKASNGTFHHIEPHIWQEGRESTIIENFDIIKASHNIIDLIEVGDYVNGYKITDINYYDRDIEEKFICASTKFIFEGKIKSVVTKEQFKACEYNVNK